MYVIKKVRADHVIDFAAEELKKYLRMMMPSCGDIGIVYEPSAEDGFRLGLLEDFGILEIAKTGTLAIERGRSTIYDDNKLKEEYNYGKNVL